MHKRRVGWLVMFGACLLLRGGYACTAELQSLSVSAATAAVPATADDATFSLGVIDWQLAPIRWAGNLGASLRLGGGSNQSRRFQDLETGNIQGRSYIWQPWFAQVSAGLGLVTSIDRLSGGNTDSGGIARSASRNTSTTLTGNLGLTLLPASRFPFQLTYDTTDSRASGELTGNDYQSRRLTLRQNYRPQTGNTNYAVGYDRSTLSSATFGNDTVTALNGSVTHGWNSQNIDANASRTRNVRSNTGETSQLSRLNARHNYRSDGTLTIDTQGSYSGTDLHLLNTGSSTDTRSRFLQLHSVGTWRPEDGHPLTMIGSARLFRSSFSSAGSDSDSSAMGANVAANYRWTPRTTLYGAVGLNYATSDAASQILTTQAAGVTYTAEAIDVGAFKYHWNTGANVANQTGGSEGGRYNLNSSIGHTLTRTIPLRVSSALNISAGQSYSINHDSVTDVSQSITHNASIGLRGSPTSESNAYLSLTASDARTYGFTENSFQIINLQSSGQVQLGRYANASANLTIQGTRQSTPSAPANGFTFNTSGNLIYNHTRAFNVPQLRYYLIYTANQTQHQSRLQGDVNAPREQANQSLEQRFDYRIGRIEMRLSGRVARTEARSDWLVYFSINRRFGDF